MLHPRFSGIHLGLVKNHFLWNWIWFFTTPKMAKPSLGTWIWIQIQESEIFLKYFSNIGILCHFWKVLFFENSQNIAQNDTKKIGKNGHFWSLKGGPFQLAWNGHYFSNQDQFGPPNWGEKCCGIHFSRAQKLSLLCFQKLI